MPRTTRTASNPGRPYHHGNLRRGLLDEALATIRTDGVEGLTLRDIGARLGVSRSALYRHFTDKRALLAAVATEGFGSLRQRLVAAWEEGGRGREAFDAMGVAYIRFAADNPAHYRVMFGGFIDPTPSDPELTTEAAGAFQALVDPLAALQRDGLVRDDETVTMARFVWAVVHGVALLCVDGRLRDAGGRDALVPYALERLHSGIDVVAAGPAPTLTGARSATAKTPRRRAAR